MEHKRKKIKLQCNRCGEIYILRGRKDKTGQIETGLKQCICDNTDDFRILSDSV